MTIRFLKFVVFNLVQSLQGLVRGCLAPRARFQGIEGCVSIGFALKAFRPHIEKACTSDQKQRTPHGRLESSDAMQSSSDVDGVGFVLQKIHLDTSPLGVTSTKAARLVLGLLG